MVRKPDVGDVEAAVRGDLAALGKLDRRIPESTIAALALEIARQLDNPRNSATSKAMCAKTLSDALDKLMAMAPEEAESDFLDELERGRTDRRAAAADRAGT